MAKRREHMSDLPVFGSRLRSNDTEGDPFFLPDDHVWEGIDAATTVSRKSYLRRFWWIPMLLLVISGSSVLYFSTPHSTLDTSLDNESVMITVTEDKENTSPSVTLETTPLIASNESVENMSVSSSSNDGNMPEGQVKNHAYSTTEVSHAGSENSVTRQGAKTKIDRASVANNPDLALFQSVELSNDKSETTTFNTVDVDDFTRRMMKINPLTVGSTSLLFNRIINPQGRSVIDPVDENLYGKLYYVELNSGAYTSNYSINAATELSVDDFRLTGPLSQIVELKLGIQFWKGISLSAGAGYRRNNFNAVYSHQIPQSEILKLKQGPEGTSFSYAHKIPSLAGGIAATIAFDKENHQGRLENAVPLSLELSHSNTLISVPIGLGYRKNVSRSWFLEAGAEVTYNHRRSTIDTAPGDITIRSDLTFKELNLIPVPQDSNPYKSHFVSTTLRSSINYRWRKMEIGLGYYFDRFGEIYKDDFYSVDMNAHRLQVGVKYILNY